jgi:hypothetical protein
MTLKFLAKPQVTYAGPANVDAGWRDRFPRNAQPMHTAPITATRPILLFEPTGKPRWGLHHLGGWHELERQKDADGVGRVRMSGRLISNAVAWASS